jgi:PAH dioxygenase large subunit
MSVVETFDPQQWIDEKQGLVSRRIFTDQAIYELEIERIFNRVWLYVGHESELPNPGDYVTRTMGDDQVIVHRSADGAIRTFLNSCAHRGAQLCRAQAGCATYFTCPYHSWTYDGQGRLVRTSFEEYYAPGLLDGVKLTEVAQIDTYHGLIFATWNPEAPPLLNWLGDLRWYLDILFGRTPRGVEVLAPPQRWVIDTNWKVVALNFQDSQHGVRTHVGPLQMQAKLSPVNLTTILAEFARSPGIAFDNGHGLTIIPFPPEFPEFPALPPELVPLYEETLQPAQFDVLRRMFGMVGGIFPNTVWVAPALMISAESPPALFVSLRTCQPLGPDRIELWNWFFAEKEASDVFKAAALRHGIQSFSPSGLFEEDDVVIWSGISRAAQGFQGRRQTMHFGAGLGEEPCPSSAPGIAYRSQFLECQQLSSLKCWAEMLRTVS